MKVVEGDLIKLALKGKFDVIVHGCNCYCTMGAGIAKFIKRKFPTAYEADCQTLSGNRSKLGTFSIARVDNLIIVNAYTQFHWKGQGVLADYEAIRSVFRVLKRKFSGKRIGYPLIGAGLAKGDWSIIERIIDEELQGEEHTLVLYNQ